MENCAKENGIDRRITEREWQKDRQYLRFASGYGQAEGTDSRFPRAHAVGIEKDNAFYNLSKCTDMVVHSVDEISALFKEPVFHILMIQKKIYGSISKDELKAIQKICRNDCILLPKID